MTGRRPTNDPEWARRVEDRLGRLESSSTTRHGQWVIRQEPITGKLQAISPDGAHDLTPDPTAAPDVVAGIVPGVFSAVRADTLTDANATSGEHVFPASWYDTVVTSSDRLAFDDVTNSVTVASTALLAVRVSQRITTGIWGNAQFRAVIWVRREGEEDPVVFSAGCNVYYANGVEAVITDSALVPVSPGDVVTPGYWCSESPSNVFTGDPAKTRFDIGRVIDL